MTKAPLPSSSKRSELSREQSLPCPPVDLVLTVCEEVGLLGAKHIDFIAESGRIEGMHSTPRIPKGSLSRHRRPTTSRFEIHGKDAHAGAAPEQGINAIVSACRAIARLHIGRIDEETTCNIGLIEGGCHEYRTGPGDCKGRGTKP